MSEKISRGRKKGTGKKLTPEQEAEIFLNFSDGFLWSIEKVKTLIQDKYQMTISQGCLHDYLKAHGILLKSYGFPGICKSEQMKKWFLKDNNLEKIKENYSSRYALYWMGTKDIGNKLNMIYFVSISGKMHWAVIKGNATETRQKKFLDKLPATVKDELGIYKNRPKRIVALRTHEKIYSNDAKHRWGNVNKIYPTTAEWLAYSLQT